MSIARSLARTLGGKWTWNRGATWICDDGVRIVSRCSAAYDDQGREPAEWWLYGDGTPRRAEEFVGATVSLDLRKAAP